MQALDWSIVLVLRIILIEKLVIQKVYYINCAIEVFRLRVEKKVIDWLELMLVIVTIVKILVYSYYQIFKILLV